MYAVSHHHAHQFLLRHPHGKGGNRKRTQRLAVGSSRFHAWSTGFFQIYQLRTRHPNRFQFVARRNTPGPASAHRHLLLHLPVHELHHRRVPPTDAGHPFAHGLRLLRQLLSHPSGRPHSACPHLPAPVAATHLHHASDDGFRHVVHRHGSVQEVHHLRLHQPELRFAHLRQSRTLFGLRKPARRLRLCPPALLRLLRLFRHGHRHCSVDGFPHPAQLPRALQERLHHRLLATLAHLALLVAPRLSLHLHGRQPLQPLADVLQPVHDHAAGRPVARCLLELCHLG